MHSAYFGMLDDVITVCIASTLYWNRASGVWQALLVLDAPADEYSWEKSRCIWRRNVAIHGGHCICGRRDGHYVGADAVHRWCVHITSMPFRSPSMMDGARVVVCIC